LKISFSDVLLFHLQLVHTLNELLAIDADSACYNSEDINDTYLIVNGYQMFENWCSVAYEITNRKNFDKMCEEL